MSRRPAEPARSAVPSVSRRILGWAARRLATPELADDADQLFRRRLARMGLAQARSWYRRQALRSLVVAIFSRRIREVSLAGAPPARLKPELVFDALAVSVRRLRRAPGPVPAFALVVGIGVGATAFMWQVRSTMLEPDLGLGRAVWLVDWVDPTGRSTLAIPLDGREAWLRDGHSSVAALTAIWPLSPVVTTPEGHTRVLGHRVEAGFLAAMGVRPEVGRDVAEPGDVVVSHRLWTARWAGDPAIVGTTIQLGGTSARVVGVAPRDFDGPICCVPSALWALVGPRSETAPAVVAVVESAHPAATASWLSGVATGRSSGARATLHRAESAPYGGETGIVGRTLALLLALAIVAWLGTLLTGANLLLAETLDRSAELRLRRALGADRRHLAIGMLTDTLLPTGLAAGVGLVIVWIGVRIGPWLLPLIGGVSSVTVEVGRAALTAIVAAAGGASIACGLPGVVTGIRLSREAFADRGPHRSRFASTALGAQIALAAVLVLVTGLFVGALRAYDGAFVGFRRGDAAVHFLSLARGSPPSHPDQVVEAARSAGFSGDVALTRRLPVYGARFDSVTLVGGAVELAAHETVTTGFFRTIGTRLIVGSPAERGDEVVLSEDLAARIAPELAATVGRAVTLGDSVRLRVVGVVEAATWGTGTVRPTLYRGWGDEPVEEGIVLTTGSNEGGFGRLLTAFAPLGLALQPFETLDGLLVRSRILQVFLTRLAMGFGGICLLVALGGVHGHFLRWVRLRQSTLGIQNALGATRRRLQRTLITQALRIVLPAAVLGCAAGWLASTSARSFLLEPPAVTARLALAVVALLIVTSIAALGGALQRIGTTDPVSLFRTE